MQVYQGRILTVPDMPAFVCDICGYQEFEYHAMQHLHALMGRADDPRTADGDTPNPAADRHYNAGDTPPGKP